MIFPEIAGSSQEKIQKFHSGFVNLAKLYQKDTGKQLPFVPVSVNKNRRSVCIGKSMFYNDQNNHLEEKQNLVNALRGEIKQHF